MNKEFSIRWDLIRSGQPRPYADSIYEYKVYSEAPEAKVKAYCTKVLEPSSQEAKAGDSFDGSSSFPYGLNSYYTFRKLDENTYYYIVCRPYTG